MKQQDYDHLSTLFESISYSERLHLNKAIEQANLTFQLVYKELKSNKESDFRAFSKKVQTIEKKSGNKFYPRKFTSFIISQLTEMENRPEVYHNVLKELQHVKIAFAKNQHDYAFKQLEKLKIKCKEYEMNDILLLLIQLQIDQSYFLKNHAIKIKDLFNDFENLQQSLQLQFDGILLRNEIQDFLFNSGLLVREKTNSDLNDFDQRLNNFLEKENITFKTKFHLQNAVSNLEIVKHNHVEAMKPMEELLNIFVADDKLQHVNFNEFVQTCINYINRLVMADLYDDVKDLSYIEGIVAQILKNKLLKKIQKEYLTLTISHARYAIHLKNWELEKALTEAKNFEENKLPQKKNKALFVIFTYELARLYFYTGDLDRSMNKLDLLLTDKSKSLFPDLHMFTRILELFISTEKEETFWFTSQYESIRKQIAAAKYDATLEKELAYMLYRFNKTDAKDEKKVILQEYASKLNANANAKTKLLMYFDIDRWIAAKLTARPIQQIHKIPE